MNIIVKFTHFLKTGIWLIVSFLLPSVGSIFVGMILYNFQTEIIHADFGLQFLISLILAILMAFALFPTTLAALFLGYCWSFGAIFWMVLAYSMATLIAKIVFSKLVGEPMKQAISSNENGIKFKKMLHKEEKWVVFSARLSPIFPFAFTNMFFAIFNLSFKNIFIWGTLGMLPRTLLAIYVGNEAFTLNQNWKNIHLYDYQSSIILLAIAFLVLFMVSYKIKKDWNQEDKIN